MIFDSRSNVLVLASALAVVGYGSACGSSTSSGGTTGSTAGAAASGGSDSGTSGSTGDVAGGGTSGGVAGGSSGGVAGGTNSGVGGGTSGGVGGGTTGGAGGSTSGGAAGGTSGGITCPQPAGSCTPCAGQMGNSIFVGQYCTAGGGQCPFLQAYCAADEPGGAGQDYCVVIGCPTFPDGGYNCGENACCYGEAGNPVHACVPSLCVTTPGGVCPPPP